MENYESIETSLDTLDYDLGYVFDGIDLNDISEHEYSSELQEIKDEIDTVRELLHPEDLELIRGRAAEIIPLIDG